LRCGRASRMVGTSGSKCVMRLASYSPSMRRPRPAKAYDWSPRKAELG
jgi:hypothetical protein